MLPEVRLNDSEEWCGAQVAPGGVSHLGIGDENPGTVIKHVVSSYLLASMDLEFEVEKKNSKYCIYAFS